MQGGIGSRRGSAHRFDLMADGPKKGGHLAGDRGDDHRWLLAGRGEPAVSGAEPDLALPGDVANGLWQPLEASAQGLADARRVAVSPRSFDEHAAGAPVAGKRQA